MARHVHIIGAGMAGLAAAVEIAGSGQRVTLYEAGPACGGRARSYDDPKLGCRIDNGNHLLLSANQTVFRYLGMTGALDTVTGPNAALFPFFDLIDGVRWTLDLGRGRLPLWAFNTRKRVPGMRLSELAGLMRLLKAGPDAVVSDCLKPGPLTRRLLEPFAISALNTPSETASAALLGNVVRESLSKGGAACVPWFPKLGLSESLVDPALAHLAVMKAELRTGCRVTGIELADNRVTALRVPGGDVVLDAEDVVILAVPPSVAASLLEGKVPGFTAPDAFESIFNAHFRLDEPPVALGSVGRAGFAGVIGGITEWVFVRGNIVSVTVSAANHYAERDPEEMGDAIWAELRAVLDGTLERPLPVASPARRLVREKRATFAATPEQERKRPSALIGVANLALAGDWTATGLPATIEGAMQSGIAAVRALGLRGPYSKA